MSYLYLTAGVLMLIGMVFFLRPAAEHCRLWRNFMVLSSSALTCTLVAVWASQDEPVLRAWLTTNTLCAVLAVMVQLLGTVIAAFSSRYLDGEANQRRYIVALAAVLAAVHLLLLANHWVVLIAAWALVGVALQHLLCFYPDRPFALLAAHKKRISDRVADLLLIGAAILAWMDVGSGSFPDLWAHIGTVGMSMSLQISAVCLVLAVILRTALLPVHGWLIQVMEAPTPVSALLHAGIVNLGAYVLIRFAPLLEHAMLARVLLLAFGLGTAVLAGLVMLTRISIKVRLAWSTVAQMGFMLVECGLGLYTLAALHLMGHSLYKAHAFLSASSVVRQTRLQVMRGNMKPASLSLLVAPIIAVPVVLLVQLVINNAAWPWWWSVVLGLAWAPLLWLPAWQGSFRRFCLQGLVGLLMISGLTAVALLAHALPLGLKEVPNDTLGVIALIGMTMLYLFLLVLQVRPQKLEAWRRMSYAGFYVDEIYTRFVLKLWPTRWTPLSTHQLNVLPTSLAVAEIPK